MTQQEFTERTSISIEEKDFAQIHEIYMQTNLDKDEFCRDFKKYGKSQIICHLYNTIVDMEKRINDLASKRYIAEEYLNMENENMGEFLARKFYETNDEELRDKAIELLGKKGYIAYLLEDDFNLFRQDKLLASELLK